MKSFQKMKKKKIVIEETLENTLGNLYRYLVLNDDQKSVEELIMKAIQNTQTLQDQFNIKTTQDNRGHNQQNLGQNPYGQGFNPYGQGFNPYGQGFNPFGQGFNPYGQGFNQQQPLNYPQQNPYQPPMFNPYNQNMNYRGQQQYYNPYNNQKK